MKFYSIMSIVLVLFYSPVRLTVLVAIVTLCPLIRIALAIYDKSGHIGGYIHQSALLQADSFAAGCLLALFRERLQLSIALKLFLFGVISLGIYFVFYMTMNAYCRGARGFELMKGIISGVIQGQLREVLIYSVLIALFSGVVAVAYCLKSKDGALYRTLGSFGRASYSGYLWHFAVLTGSRFVLISLGLSFDPSWRWSAMPPRILLWGVTMAVIVPFSLILYRFVERPFFKLGLSVMPKTLSLSNR